jgi:hypothetical protein
LQAAGTFPTYRLDQIVFWQEHDGRSMQAHALPRQMLIPARHTGNSVDGQLTEHAPQFGWVGVPHAWESPNRKNALAGVAPIIAAPTIAAASNPPATLRTLMAVDPELGAASTPPDARGTPRPPIRQPHWLNH